MKNKKAVNSVMQMTSSHGEKVVDERDAKRRVLWAQESILIPLNMGTLKSAWQQCTSSPRAPDNSHSDLRTTGVFTSYLTADLTSTHCCKKALIGEQK
jgi:hypothetical protein